MFNKYQRDLQAKRVAELQKQRVVSGYLRDDKFETSPALQRVLASPSRTINSSPIGGKPNQTGSTLPEQKSINPNASQTSLTASTSPLPGASTSMMGNGLMSANGIMLSDEAKRMIKIRSKRTNDLANRSRQRIQGWLSNVGQPIDLLSKIEDIEKPLKSRINTHHFRDEQTTRHISPKKFQVRLKYQTPKERIDHAQAEASVLLSSGEKMSTRPPFVFRAHEPLKSTTRGFMFKPITEQERITDKLNKNELFETDNFDRLILTKADLHRTASKTRWISPKNFTVANKRAEMSMPPSARHSLMQDGFMMKSTQQSMFAEETEPYEDPSLVPGFVRTTKEFLKQSHLYTIRDGLKREEQMALKNVGKAQTIEQTSDHDGGLSSVLSFLPGTTKDKNQSTRNRIKPNSVTVRKSRGVTMGTQEPTNNAYFDTYQKMNSLMQTLQAAQPPQPHSKPSLKNLNNAGINVSGLRSSNLDSLYNGGVQNMSFRQSSPLTREMAVTMRNVNLNSRESQKSVEKDKKEVAFSLNDPTSPKEQNSPAMTFGGQTPSKGFNSSALMNQTTKRDITQRNFKIKTKQSIERNTSRNITMVETMDSFFDSNKLYLKSVQQEATMRGKRTSRATDDPLYEDPPTIPKNGAVNKQAF